MSDQLLGILIPAIALVAAALITALAGAGRGRDTAVLLALAEKNDKIRRLEDKLDDLEDDNDDDTPRVPHG